MFGARQCDRPQGGFTLLEILVVLVILGVVMTFATLSIGDGGRAERIETEARRFAALVDLASDEAVLEARELGLMLTPEGYQFLVLGREDWGPLDDDRLLRPRHLGEEMAVELRVEGMPVAVDEDPEKPRPHVVFTSSGERTPFEFELGAPDSFGDLDGDGPLYLVTSGPFGRVELTGPGIAPPPEEPR